MEEWRLSSIGTLSEEVLNKLAKMLDNASCGWRQLAKAVAEEPRFCYSESELTSCSLQALSPTGSSALSLLALLVDRSCSLDFLLSCLKKIDHQEASVYLTAAVKELIWITVHPQSQQASAGSRVVLTCKAAGFHRLSYQWFKGNKEILDETGCTPELALCPLASVHQGYYICRVSHGENCVFSQWAHVRLVHSADSGSASGLRVIQQPWPKTLSDGDTLVLECRAEANPPAQYQWYHNMEPLSQHKTPSLRIPCVTTAHRGQYRCKMFNLYHEEWSKPATVTIGPTSLADISWVEIDRGQDSQPMHRSASGSVMQTPDQSAEPLGFSKDLYATDKVALLIGNMNYVHHTELCAPMSDVHELTNLLRQMDFKVVSLLDLNWQEMHSAVTEFLLLLDKGVYGLLYFAGHGYENYGNSFMVPIDAPASYTSDHCLCVQNILTRMQEKETGLNVFLLDMCRKRNPNDDAVIQTGLLKVTANIVFGYATCVDAEAYEVKKEDVSNGIFINFLKQHVCEDEKVTVMLDRVAEDMGRCVLTRGRQALELRSNLSERRSLTDPIRNSDCPAASSARNLQWAVAHVLPESCVLQFECGVSVQLGFAAEFSNVMVIYTRILEQPSEIVSCSAQLTDFNVDVDIDLKQSNQESLLEAGSLLLIEESLPSPDVPSLYTRIQSLQRLRSELTFTVCLHYRYYNMEEEVQERHPVTVGKPLVSKLNLHEPRLPLSASLVSLDNFSVTKFSPPTFASGSSSTQSCDAETGRKSATTDCPTISKSANMPEETDCPELYDCDMPQPLVASKSLSGQFSDMCRF
ncbi:MALT paracaspase 2 isoform X2 [Thalassophryne amazonica]|uniref:MALT paracaspase 2 isoform X2 n=1 Tax=Thalassophryne amazonica TaxID=390379 RepID=UPI0014718930|nr:MALT paracaspase 2 isoform X2 [Thalassophryne amazonica]